MSVICAYLLIATSYEVTGATAFGYKVLNKDGSVFKDVVEGYNFTVNAAKLGSSNYNEELKNLVRDLFVWQYKNDYNKTNKYNCYGLTQNKLKSTDLFDEKNAKKYFTKTTSWAETAANSWYLNEGGIKYYILASFAETGKAVADFDYIIYDTNNLEVTKNGQFKQGFRSITVMGRDSNGQKHTIMRLKFYNPNLYLEWVSYMRTGK